MPGDIEVVSLEKDGATRYALFKVVSVAGDKVTLRAHRDTMPERAVSSQAEGFSLGDGDFSGPTFSTYKDALPPLGTATINEAIRPSQP